MKIKTIIRWEQLQGKAFSQIDMDNVEEMVALLYCRAICEKGVRCSLRVYTSTTTNYVLFSTQIESLKDELSIMDQFMQKDGGEGINGASDAIRISDIVPMLIMAGLNAHYAMNEMELYDIPMYLSAYENKRRELMEDRRLWTYLTILPHIDASEMTNGAKDLITFPWEDSQKEIADEDVAQFERFMEKGVKLE